MANIRSFKELRVWQNAIDAVVKPAGLSGLDTELLIF
jgi:hypothetical protein